MSSRLDGQVQVHVAVKVAVNVAVNVNVKVNVIGWYDTACRVSSRRAQAEITVNEGQLDHGAEVGRGLLEPGHDAT